MDTIRAQIIKQQIASPEDKKKHQRALLVSHFISLILYIPMVVIGCQNKVECKNDAALYLIIGGGLGLGLTLLKILAILTPSECDDKFANGLSPLASLFGFGVTIWGSIVVFGAYSTWTYTKDNEGSGNGNTSGDDDDYCPYTPFMFAFVLLILEWILRPLIFCCECVCLCLSCCGGRFSG